MKSTFVKECGLIGKNWLKNIIKLKEEESIIFQEENEKIKYLDAIIKSYRR